MGIKTIVKEQRPLGTTLLKRDYAAKVAGLKRARGALSRYGKGLTRELAKLRKERDRPLPSLTNR